VSDYSTLVVDPPWPQKGGGPLAGGHAEGFIGTAGSRPMPYATMSVPQIAAMPIADVAAKDAHLYMWTTNRFLPDAFAVMAAWGFRYSTTIVWGKAPIGAGLGGAHGIATEFVLFGRRGNLRATGRIGRNWFTWKRPYNAQGKPMHSAKPPEFYTEVVEPVSPGPRLEMFARRARPGWDVWGDQAPGSVHIPALDEPEVSLLDLLEDGAA
jgi:N6-adenosine-specific RNA methylase IME4